MSRNFDLLLKRYEPEIAQIRLAAHSLHQSVNQTYGGIHPYGYHLDMVVQNIRDYGHLVLADERDLLPLVFGGYFHDSIEDARQTYNDTISTACRFMDRQQALMAAEIVYALTNDKGRTRAERAGERYYAGIRQTPYAPFVKLCDRMANTAYSLSDVNKLNARMCHIYRQEMPSFLAAINAHSDDRRLAVPAEMVERIDRMLAADTTTH
ncbi:MAG: hypothetical protein K5928_04100 [Prevotella sp.]|nr:hypothetical protein [Prevotella sp.]